MKRIVTHQTVVKTVAELWRQQYEPGGWITTTLGPSRERYDKLLALPESATDDDIADIIGNSGWTSIGCSECDKKGVLIRFEQRETKHQDFRCMWVCKPCLKKALNLAVIKRSRKAK